jgi:3'-phosphoadenosine 5'-phosphosulfate sulfotransferase (PAPS reductase)/FAD synthetase
MAILRDWSKLRVMQSDNYPRKQVVMVPIRRWTEEEQENYIKERIRIHQNAEKVSELPLCTASERWRKEDKFAVMKSGRKSAWRLFDTRQLALDFLKSQNMVEGKGCSIVERLGEDTRCMHYCSVNKFCSHYMKVNF